MTDSNTIKFTDSYGNYVKIDGSQIWICQIDISMEGDLKTDSCVIPSEYYKDDIKVYIRHHKRSFGHSIDWDNRGKILDYYKQVMEPYEVIEDHESGRMKSKYYSYKGNKIGLYTAYYDMDKLQPCIKYVTVDGKYWDIEYYSKDGLIKVSVNAYKCQGYKGYHPQGQLRVQCGEFSETIKYDDIKDKVPFDENNCDEFCKRVLEEVEHDYESKQSLFNEKSIKEQIETLHQMIIDNEETTRKSFNEITNNILEMVRNLESVKSQESIKTHLDLLDHGIQKCNKQIAYLEDKLKTIEQTELTTQKTTYWLNAGIWITLYSILIMNGFPSVSAIGLMLMSAIYVGGGLLIMQFCNCGYRYPTIENITSGELETHSGGVLFEKIAKDSPE